MNMRLIKRAGLLLFIAPPMASAVTISANTIQFGDQQIFTTSTTKMLTLKNTSTKTENIWNLKLSSSDFSRVTNDCPSSLAPGKSCTNTFKFAPLSTGTHNGTVSISTSLTKATVTLSGVGTNPPSATFGPKKWNPGHYAQLPFGFDSSAVSRITSTLPPEIKGLMVAYSWVKLEKSKDVYDFTSVLTDLQTLKAKGKRLVAIVVDKDFTDGKPVCVPSYMRTDPLYAGGQQYSYKNTGEIDACVSKRWEPAVMDRMIALYRALGKAVDQDPYFEGVTTQETAVEGVTGRDNIRKYVDQWKRWASAMPGAFPTSLTTLWTNWKIWPYQAELVDHLYRNGVGFGGPDMVPPPYYSTEFYPLFPKYAGKTYVMMGVQPTHLIWKKTLIRDGLLTLDDVFHFGVNDPNGINASHLFWWYFTSTKDPYNFWDSVKVIRTYGGQINSTCPQNLICKTQ